VNIQGLAPLAKLLGLPSSRPLTHFTLLMTSALVWFALALAALGHGFLWSGIVNRLHGWGAPRLLIKSLTLACLAGLLGMPALIAWHEV
jgi:hypothetical protein